MKNRSLKRALFISILVLSIFGAATFLPWAWAAISNISGIAVQGSGIQWNNVKDASQGDALTNGLPASASYGYNGATWDRLRSDTTNGLDVDVTRVQGTVTIAGGTTPADAFANPTAALTEWSLLGGFNGTTWDRLRTATIGDGVAATGILAGAKYVFNGTTWDRARSGGNNADGVAVATLGAQSSQGYQYGFNGTTWDRIRSSSLSSDIGAVKVNFAFSYKNIITNDNTVVKSGAGILHTLTVGTAGATSSVIAYDNTSAAGIIIGTFSTLAQTTLILDINFSTGLTLAPSGGTPANLTVAYK